MLHHSFPESLGQFWGAFNPSMSEFGWRTQFWLLLAPYSTRCVYWIKISFTWICRQINMLSKIPSRYIRIVSTRHLMCLGFDKLLFRYRFLHHLLCYLYQVRLFHHSFLVVSFRLSWRSLILHLVEYHFSLIFEHFSELLVLDWLRIKSKIELRIIHRATSSLRFLFIFFIANFSS